MNARLVPTPISMTSDGAKKERMIRTLRRLVADTCQLRNEGVAYAKLAHSQGYADGYMRLLIDGDFLTQQELLDIVVEVRRGIDGPATRSISEPTALSA